MKKEADSSYQVIYGIHPVKESLHSGNLKTQRVFVSTRNPNPALQAVLEVARHKGVPITYAQREELDRMARGGVHQNVVGVIQEFPYADLNSLLPRSKKDGEKALFLVLDGIQDPQNLGSLIRTALGFGAHGIIIPKDRAVGITPAVMKASAGAASHLPIARVVNIADTIEKLKKEGIWIYGAAGEARSPIYDLDFNIDLGIVIGAEGKGIRPLVKKKCDLLFSIPMRGSVSSFNASVSGGMILYEVMRQRHIASSFEQGTV